MTLESLIQSILIYQPQKQVTKISTGEVRITSNISNCVYEATNGTFGLIIICLPVKKVGERQPVFELCDCLKTHPLTQDTPVVASVDCLHRGITMKLADAGLSLIDVRPPGAPIDPESVLYRVQLDDLSIHIHRILDRLCPCMHYQPIDDQSELPTCQAYGHRMVLGGRRLHEVCETEDHIYCDYFLNPRLIE